MTADVCLTACHFTLTGAARLQPPRWPLKDRLTAAAQAGFGGVGLRPEDILDCCRQGTSISELARIIADLGLEVHELESVHGWYLASTARRGRAVPARRRIGRQACDGGGRVRGATPRAAANGGPIPRAVHPCCATRTHSRPGVRAAAHRAQGLAHSGYGRGCRRLSKRWRAARFVAPVPLGWHS